MHREGRHNPGCTGAHDRGELRPPRNEDQRRRGDAPGPTGHVPGEECADVPAGLGLAQSQGQCLIVFGASEQSTFDCGHRNHGGRNRKLP